MASLLRAWSGTMVCTDRLSAAAASLPSAHTTAVTLSLGFFLTSKNNLDYFFLLWERLTPRLSSVNNYLIWVYAWNRNTVVNQPSVLTFDVQGRTVHWEFSLLWSPIHSEVDGFCCHVMNSAHVAVCTPAGLSSLFLWYTLRPLSTLPTYFSAPPCFSSLLSTNYRIF